jgi:hypothetical protein
MGSIGAFPPLMFAATKEQNPRDYFGQQMAAQHSIVLKKYGVACDRRC